VAFGGWAVGITAAGVGAGPVGVGDGDGAFRTTPLGDSAVLGRYTQASVAPRITSGMKISSAMNGTTRRFESSSVGPPTSAAGSS
jgi:hypothetical protein